MNLGNAPTERGVQRRCRKAAKGADKGVEEKKGGGVAQGELIGGPSRDQGKQRGAALEIVGQKYCAVRLGEKREKEVVWNGRH